MQRTSITPNRTSLLRPMHSRHTIMVPRDQPHYMVPHHLLLISIQIINPTHMQPYTREHALPPRHWVRPHHGVGWRELVVDVQRRAAGCHDGVVAGFAGGLEDGLSARGSEGLEEALHGRRAAVVQLVSGNPEGVAAGWRGGLHAEEGVVGRAVLEEAWKVSGLQ